MSASTPGGPTIPKSRVFDVIVVGTGAGGGTAMKMLCEGGLKVLALNSGPRTQPATDYRMHRQVYDLKYRGWGDPWPRGASKSRTVADMGQSSFVSAAALRGARRNRAGAAPCRSQAGRSSGARN